MRQTKLNSATLVIIAVVVGIMIAISAIRAKSDDGENGQNSPGAKLFSEKGCIHCHYPDKTDYKAGPGLKKLLKREKFPVSGWPATRENVRKQLIEPYDSMPSYEQRLSEEQMKQMLDYIQTL